SAAAVWQQSQARSSSTVSGAAVPSAETVVVRTVISFVAGAPSASANLRPSSQTAARAPAAAGNNETKPCSVAVPSRCGTTWPVHVAPPSAERATCTSYAYVPGPLRTSQCAASEPSGSATTDGKSAQFTKKCGPRATVRAADHAASPSSVCGPSAAKRSACVLSE